jgi:signal recognition particle subunit SRP19
MVRKGSEQVVLWPRYFDARLSRAEGRRVAKEYAVKDPTAEWIASAAKKAGFAPEVEEKARHPALPYKVVGRVLVKKRDSKEATVRQVAKRMSE